MGSKIEYVDATQMAASNYVRNSKAVGVLWAIFTICYCVIAGVVLAAPEWVGDAAAEPPGRLGAWQLCRAAPGGEACAGRLHELSSLPGVVFRVTAVLVALAAALALAAVCAMLLFFFCSATTVFHICGWLHLLSALSMLLGVALFPAAWSEPAVRQLCGPGADQYRLGTCSVRWAYMLGGIACLDAVILSALAFLLATRHIRLHPDSPYNNADLYRGAHNKAFCAESGSALGSRKSLALQPVLALPPPPPHGAHDDTYSQYSRAHKPAPLYRL